MNVAREVTAELFRAIAEYTYDWESWIDVDGTTRWVNAAVARITGYSVSECLSLPDYPLSLSSAADRPILERVLADARAGGSGNDVEFRIVTKSGDVRWVAISWQSVRSAQNVALGYRTSIRDIHERKQMEEELHRLRRRAEALAQARSELLANVSHELRTPAHCIAGFAELLQEEQLSPKQQRYVALIGDQCRSMLRQVEDLLSLTALEAGGVEFAQERVDLRALVQGLVEASRPLAAAHGITLSADVQLDEPHVETDGLRLTQILRNLVDNALKFTDHGSVRVSVHAKGAERVAFEVIDTGAGMDEAQIEHLLQPFRQGEAGRARRGGVGLGLAIVQRLVRAMGGELAFRSQKGRGTHVTVTLPLAKAGQSAAALEPSDLHMPGCALIVDDNAAARELLVGFLEAAGVITLEADSSAAAKQVLAERDVDVIFLDYQMPDSDGAETALALRRIVAARNPQRHVPILILTANVFVHEQLGQARSYVDAVLSKPLSRAALLHVLRRLGAERPAQATPAPVEPALLDEEVVSDLARTPHRTGRSWLQKLLPDVARDMDDSLAAARRALAARQATESRHAAHALAGHAALIGAARAARIARHLEVSLQSDTHPAWEEAGALFEACAAAWAAALPKLQERAESQT